MPLLVALGTGLGVVIGSLLDKSGKSGGLLIGAFAGGTSGALLAQAAGAIRNARARSRGEPVVCVRSSPAASSVQPVILWDPKDKSRLILILAPWIVPAYLLLVVVAHAIEPNLIESWLSIAQPVSDVAGRVFARIDRYADQLRDFGLEDSIAMVRHLWSIGWVGAILGNCVVLAMLFRPALRGIHRARSVLGPMTLKPMVPGALLIAFGTFLLLFFAPPDVGFFVRRASTGLIVHWAFMFAGATLLPSIIGTFVVGETLIVMCAIIRGVTFSALPKALQR